MDLMTVRHSNIDVLDNAEENRKKWLKKEASGQGPQTGPREPSLGRTSAQTAGVHDSLAELFRTEMMDFMTVRHSNNDVLDDAVDNR